MPRGPHPKRNARRKPRTEPVLDHVLQLSIDKVNGQHHPETGFYGEVLLDNMGTKDHAREIVRALYRSARYMDVSLSQKIEKSGDHYAIRFSVINKEHARRYVNAIAPEKRAYNQHIRVVEGN